MQAGSSDNLITLLQGAVFAVSLICAWKIYSDRGEAGWKALIPFYSSYVFGRIVRDKPKGIALMISALFAVVSGIVFYSFLAALLSLRSSGPVIDVGLVLSGLCMSVSVLVFFALQIILKVRFVQNENGSIWLALLWIVLPIFGDIYYAFIHRPVKDTGPDPDAPASE
ncbi:MAG: hypothetical protein IKD66_10175 [Solobacterium sp.]|nr:hypothetical protein [Solobacterium sp.]